MTSLVPSACQSNFKVTDVAFGFLKLLSEFFVMKSLTLGEANVTIIEKSDMRKVVSTLITLLMMHPEIIALGKSLI